MPNKPTAPENKPPQDPTPPAELPKKKKLSLDVNDVSEVLERKISP